MALIEMLALREDKQIETMFQELVAGAEPYRREMWYQIVDRPELEENYLETSGTMMLCYAYFEGRALVFLAKNIFEKGKRFLLRH